MTEYNRVIFSGTLIHANIFRLELLQAYFDTWSTQDKFLTELNSPISDSTFLFATIFNILISSNFAHIPNMSFPINLVYNGENLLSISFFIFEK